jgi:predicted Holliday junction resolvase-like endonuclease
VEADRILKEERFEAERLRLEVERQQLETERVKFEKQKEAEDKRLKEKEEAIIMKKITDKRQESPQQSQVFLSGVVRSKLLGEGSYGQVYAGKWLGTDVAIKTFKQIKLQISKRKFTLFSKNNLRNMFFTHMT